MAKTAVGKNRIKGKLPKNTEVAHRTGSSDTTDAGLTGAINDIGIVQLPNGKHIFIAVFGYPFCFQASEETFGRRIIPTVSATAHTLLDATTPQRLAKRQARIVAALIRMEHHAFWLIARFKSHAQCL